MKKSIKSKKKFKLVPESDMDSQTLTQFAEKFEKSSIGVDGNAKGSCGRNRKPLKVSKPDAKNLQPIPEDKIESFQAQLSDESGKISLLADDYGRANRSRRKKPLTVSVSETVERSQPKTESKIKIQIQAQSGKKSEINSIIADGSSRGNRGRKRKDLIVSEPHENKHSQLVSKSEMESQVEAQFANENEIIPEAAGNRGRKRKDLTAPKTNETGSSQLDLESGFERQIQAQGAIDLEKIPGVPDDCGRGNRRRKRGGSTASKSDAKELSQPALESEVGSQFQAQLAEEVQKDSLGADDCGRAAAKHGRKKKATTASKPVAKEHFLLVPESEMESCFPAQRVEEVEKTSIVADVFDRGKRNGRRKPPTVSKSDLMEPSELKSESEMESQIEGQLAIQIKNSSIVADGCGRESRGRKRTTFVSKQDEKKHLHLVSESKIESQLEVQLTEETEKISIVPDECIEIGNRGRKKKSLAISKLDDKNHSRLVLESETESKIQVQLAEEIQRDSVLTNDFGRGNCSRKKKASTVSKPAAKEQSVLVPESEMESHIQAQLAREIEKKSIVTDDFSRGNRGKRKKDLAVPKPKNGSQLVPESEMESKIQTQPANESQRDSTVVHDFGRANHGRKGKVLTIFKPDAEGHLQLVPEDKSQSKVQCAEVGKFSIGEDDYGKGRRGRKKTDVTSSKGNAKENNHNTSDAFPKHSPFLQKAQESNVPALMHDPQGNNETGASCSPDNKPEETCENFEQVPDSTKHGRKGKVLTISKPNAEGHLQLVPEDKTQSKIQCAEVGNFSIVEDDYGKGRRGRKKNAVALSKRNAKENNHNTSDAFPKHCPFLKRAQESNVPDLMHDPQGNNVTGASCSPDNKPEETCENIEEVPNSTKHSRKGKVLTISKPDAEGHLQLVPEDETQSKIQCAEVGKFSIVEDDYGKGRRGRKKIAMTLSKRNVKENNHNTSDAFPKHSPFLERAQESNVPDLMHDPQGNNETGASCSPDNKPEETCENIEQVPDSTELKASEHQNRKSRKRPAFYLTSDLKKHQRARKIPFDSLPVGFGLGITGWPSSREIVAEHLSPLPLQVDEKVNDNCVEPIENDQESTRGKGKDSSAVQSVVKSSHADCKVHPSEAVQTSENQLTLSTGLMNKSIEQCGKASLRNLISSNGIATEKSRRKKQPLPASHLTLRTSRHKKDSRK